jgi:hypothetical protein
MWSMSEDLHPDTHAELEEVERKVERELEPGIRGVGIAGALLVLIVAMLLPHTGGASGWDVLLLDASARAEDIRLPSRLFVGGAVLFTVVVTALALLTRRWALAWVAAAGSGLTSLFGLLAVWSRQTVGIGATGAGPGAGLILTWIVVLVVTFHWLRLVWTQVPSSRRQREEEFIPKLLLDD